jgi:hypothetical protein
MSTINAGTTVPTALTLTGNTDGTLDLATGGTTRMLIDGSGNVGVGTTSLGTAGLSLSQTFNLSWEQSSTESIVNMFRQASSAATVVSNGYKRSATANGFASSYGSSWAKTALGLGVASGAITFYTDSAATASAGTDVTPTERMRITSAGNVGIGTAGSSNVRLDIYAGTSAAGSYCVAFRNSSATNLFYIENHGTIFTGSAANSPYNLTTGSAANVFVDSAGALYRSTSSLRYKSDITNAEHGLADVLKLRSVTYKAKNSGDTVFGGLIAEEVHDAGLTEFVSYDKEGQPDAIHYGNMVALLTKAIQEQQAMIDELKAKVAALETK